MLPLEGIDFHFSYWLLGPNLNIFANKKEFGEIGAASENTTYERSRLRQPKSPEAELTFPGMNRGWIRAS